MIPLLPELGLADGETSCLRVSSFTSEIDAIFGDTAVGAMLACFA
jgi:hypothetical protein